MGVKKIDPGNCAVAKFSPGEMSVVSNVSAASAIVGVGSGGRRRLREDGGGGEEEGEEEDGSYKPSADSSQCC